MSELTDPTQVTPPDISAHVQNTRTIRYRVLDHWVRLDTTFWVYGMSSPITPQDFCWPFFGRVFQFLKLITILFYLFIIFFAFFTYFVQPISEGTIILVYTLSSQIMQVYIMRGIYFLPGPHLRDLNAGGEPTLDLDLILVLKLPLWTRYGYQDYIS